MNEASPLSLTASSVPSCTQSHVVTASHTSSFSSPLLYYSHTENPDIHRAHRLRSSFLPEYLPLSSFSFLSSAFPTSRAPSEFSHLLKVFFLLLVAPFLPSVFPQHLLPHTLLRQGSWLNLELTSTMWQNQI